MSTQAKGWRRYKESLWVVTALAVPIFIYFSGSKPIDHPSFVQQILARMAAPIQRCVVGVLDGSRDIWRGYIALVDVQADNARLKEAIDQLSAANARLTEEVRQVELLRPLINIPAQLPYVHLVHAQIIAVSPSPLFRSVRIDRGTHDNLAQGAAVISHQGVVGRVATVYADCADVMLLTDANSSADVLVQRTRARARVRGQGGDNDFVLDAQYVDRTADVEPGDLLITGGLGQTFPKGLEVGHITGIERRAFGLYQRAIVQPSVDFSRLEHVLVITTDTEVVPAGQETH